MRAVWAAASSISYCGVCISNTHTQDKVELENENFRDVPDYMIL